MKDKLILGIDIGSISIKTALIDHTGGIITDTYTRILGDSLDTLRERLVAIERQYASRIGAVGITGSGGKQVADAIGAIFVNELLCQSAFAGRYHPTARSIIEMGGADAKLISIATNAATGEHRIEDFAMNAACAAGTGSFLDQQANRLHLTIEQFSEIALKSKQPPRVAGRCSVFAKSDMIHLQQIATPDYDIVAGLCHAMARNFKATVGRGKTLATPLLFLGGVAENLGMRRAFLDILKLSESEMLVPDHFNTSGAIGAALSVIDRIAPPWKGVDGLLAATATADGTTRMARLATPKRATHNPDNDAETASTGLTDAWLGVDVGSVSTNVVVIDRDRRVLSKRYLPTAGRPIEAVKQGLAEVGAEVGRRVRIRGAGTTGSGRYLTGDMIGADVIKNEITAQATAAASIDPSVDTIFEIGGQDSKYIRLANGVVVDFEMNKACAAGTGSFLEEQAERLGIRIKQEFEGRALCAESPCRFGERCTVFMESDLVHAMNNGASVEDLTAGLAYSIAHNYLNKVVAGRPVGNRIFFQGGVAANRSVVAAFEQTTGRAITVPPHHEVTGAIGAAILSMHAAPTASGFKGFDLGNREYTIKTFECAECANRCEIRRVSFDGEPPLFYGSRCEKYDVKKTAAASSVRDLFAERERILNSFMPQDEQADARPTIGIPRTLYLNDYLPFWTAFFRELGFRVLLSGRTSRTLVNRSLEATIAETCFPAKVGLGHVLDLLDKKADLLFLPSFIRFPAVHQNQQNSQACPYAQSFPYVAEASIDLSGARVLKPALYLQDQRHFEKSIRSVGKACGRSTSEVARALERARHAHDAYHDALERCGRDAVASLNPDMPALVLIGRTYNTCDPGLNMNLAAKIRDLGVQAIPMDFLPLHEIEHIGREQMYWRSGQKILAAARYISSQPHLYPVYITNFGCGPDSFITHFFRKELGDRPFLQLELDEHSADAGAITRIEAFLDSIDGKRQRSAATPLVAHRRRTTAGSLRDKKVYVPSMTDHAHTLAAAYRACGVDAEVLPESDEETVRIGRKHSSGRECYPLVLTIGDMIKATRRPGFVPEKTAFLMPSGKGPCRFGQYHRYHRQVLDSIGLHDTEILSPMQDETLQDDTDSLDRNFVVMGWRGVLAVDMIQKALRETRPYELQKGQTDRVYAASLDRIVAAVERREDLIPTLDAIYRDFGAIETSERNRPIIGIVGEIYVRSNRFSNENIVAQIEQLGGEAWVAPISEWILYLSQTAKVSARMKGSWKALFRAYATDWVQHRDERRFHGRFNGRFRSLHEPTIEKTLRTAQPYLHHSFEGEAVLSIGKAIDYIGRGASGIVNVMPFSCMPGTISTALLKKVREQHGDIPLLNIAYEGQGGAQTLTRLEAFMHQASKWSSGMG